jgi:hypothetical protein
MTMATSPAQLFVRENRFYGRTAIALSVIVLAGFALFDVLAAIQITKLPLITHVHAFLMASWLALFVTQSLLGAGRNLALHRKLGWFGAGLVILIVIVAWLTGYDTIAAGRAAPVFDPAYFHALTLVQPVLFATLVYSAIALRKRTDWHRRLMLGALIVILEPLLGRLTIMGAIIAMGGPDAAIAFFGQRLWLAPVIEMGLQLGVLAFVMSRDRAMRGSVHPALWLTGVAVVALYAANWALASFAPFVEWTRAIAPAAA